jgi:NAD(P)-dependent dehydrogenase (short-subunit alcohol dehydrogenase family)
MHVVQDTGRGLGRRDILVNNAAEQHPQDDLAKITSAQLERTFRTNTFSFFSMTKAALPHCRDGSAMINTTSVTAYRGSPHLLNYAATRGARSSPSPARWPRRWWGVASTSTG